MKRPYQGNKMKKFITILMMGALLFIAGCTSNTEYGECIGVAQEHNPDLKYEYDLTNIVIAIIFSETIIVPVIIIATDLKCPTGKASKQ